MLFFLLISLFLVPLALGYPSDILYIPKLSADEAQYVKTGDFARHGGWRIRERLFVSMVSFVRNVE